MKGRLLTCYSPVRRSSTPEGAFPLDLHVLSTPPAFVLSQDQTLHRKQPLRTENNPSQKTKLANNRQNHCQPKKTKHHNQKTDQGIYKLIRRLNDTLLSSQKSDAHVLHPVEGIRCERGMVRLAAGTARIGESCERVTRGRKPDRWSCLPPHPGDRGTTIVTGPAPRVGKSAVDLDAREVLLAAAQHQPGAADQVARRTAPARGPRPARC